MFIFWHIDCKCDVNSKYASYSHITAMTLESKVKVKTPSSFLPERRHLKGFAGQNERRDRFSCPRLFLQNNIIV